MDNNTGLVPNGAFTYLFEADRDKIRVHLGFLRSENAMYFDIEIEDTIKIPYMARKMTIGTTVHEGFYKPDSTLLDRNILYESPKQVPASLASNEFETIAIACVHSPNEKFKQDVEYNTLDYDYARKYPFEINVVNEQASCDDVNGPHFYYWPAKDMKYSDIRLSVALSTGTTLVARSGKLSICEHKDTEKLTRTVNGGEIELSGKTPLKGTKKKKSYDYIKYCDGCERIIEVI